MSIQSSALLVELSISTWQAQKLDKETTRKVATDNNAAEDSGKFHKNLMAGTTKRKEIADYAASTRLWHNEQTLAWADRGMRIIPTSLFMASYKTDLNARKFKFQKMVDDFIVAYPALVQTAQNYLGSLFKAEDYPSAEEVRSKFGFRFTVSPIASSSDFRLQLAEQEMLEIRQQYEESFNERLAEAVREPWDRLHKMLSGMSSKLTEVEGEENKKRWHNTFVTNAQEMVGMLTHLNLTKDPKLEQARRELELTMLGADIDNIKESPEVRKDLKDKVDAILKKFEW